VQDNFFDLGGDSLAVEEVLAQMEQKFHVTFPPDVFIQGATIAALATLLHQPETPVVKSALVAIQPAGSKPPFFCASGYDGTALPLRRLGPHLAPDQPLYGLRDPRLEYKEVSFLTVEDLASRYIEILRAQQPQGPYYLGGYSFGCLVAYEIAQQLQKAGQQVKGPIFLDLPRVSRPPGPGLVPRVQMDFIKQKGPFEALKTIVRRLFMLTKRFTPSVVGPLSVREANILAKAAYRPQIYPGRVVFFQTRDNQDVPYLWEPLITAGIEVHHIPGDHHTMLREPHLQILVDKLKPVLLQLQADV
jgi:thioesterase domain-containing protein